jgi:phage baseplate assembly protein W
MASLKITALSPTNYATGDIASSEVVGGYTYKDIFLDLETGNLKSNELFKSPQNRDLVAIYDATAIKTSLSNLFNTNNGERVLTPNFGLNLKKYLFLPVTPQNALLIGNEIKSSIVMWEPRVTVQQIAVVTDADNYTYEITLVVSLNNLQNSSLTLPGILSNSGFQFIQ